MATQRVLREICLCNGPAQFLTLCAALFEDEMRNEAGAIRQRVFVLSAHSTSVEFRQFLLGLVSRSGLAHRIVCCWDWPEWSGFFDDACPSRPYRFVRSRLGMQEADTVWISRLPLPLDRLVASVYRDAGLVVYEEGTLSYTKYPDARIRDYISDSEIGTAVKLRLRRLSSRGGVMSKVSRGVLRCFVPSVSAHRPDLSARVVRFYGYLQDRLGPPEYISEADIRSIGRDARERASRLLPTFRLGIPEPTTTGLHKRALVLGLPYQHVEKQGITREAIRAFYLQWTSGLVQAGYQIIWKSHPRDVSNLPDFLKDNLGDAFVVLASQACLPIESLYTRINPDVVVASVSTSLFTAHTIYGLPVATYARAMEKELGYPKRDADLERISDIPEVSSLM